MKNSIDFFEVANSLNVRYSILDKIEKVRIFNELFNMFFLPTPKQNLLTIPLWQYWALAENNLLTRLLDGKEDALELFSQLKFLKTDI
nr:hypothetical protein [Acinetobacter sp. Marseille-Q1620]